MCKGDPRTLVHREQGNRRHPWYKQMKSTFCKISSTLHISKHQCRPETLTNNMQRFLLIIFCDNVVNLVQLVTVEKRLL
jgi:hypothetical protein